MTERPAQPEDALSTKVRRFYDHEALPGGELGGLTFGRGLGLRNAILAPLEVLRSTALGPLARRRLLELGGGYGEEAVELARRGAEVTLLDFAVARLRQAPARAAAAGVEIACLAADCHHLPLRDSSFDLLYGNAVLAHLERGPALSEARRVLRPGGRLVLIEPLDSHPLLGLYRRLLQRGEVARYMGWAELDGDHLGAGYRLEPLGLTAALLLVPAALGLRGGFWRGLAGLAHRLDDWLFARSHWARRHAWICLAVYDKASG